MEPLLIERHDNGVVVLRLNLPERRNAMTEQLTAAWGEAMRALAGDRAVRCVVVTGAGTAFCAGGDLSWIEASGGFTVDDLRARMLPFYRTWLAIRELEAPTIAALNGAAVGAGLALALACDLRYATPEAKLSAPFTALGMHPGMATTWLLPEVAGLPVAREMLLTGRVLTGAEAVAAGLVSRTFPAATLLDDVLGIAAEVAAMPSTGGDAADQGSPGSGRACQLRGGAGLGVGRTARHAGVGRPAGGAPSGAGAAATPVHRPLTSPAAIRCRDSGPRVETRAFGRRAHSRGVRVAGGSPGRARCGGRNAGDRDAGGRLAWTAAVVATRTACWRVGGS